MQVNATKRLFVLILSGPNLNLLGSRQPEIYGSTTLAEIGSALDKQARGMEVDLEHFQSNHEGALIDRLHEARLSCHGIVFNPGGFTHTSVALRDAISAIELPVVETHLSNVAARDEFRHHSYLAPVCLGVVSGFGPASYGIALTALVDHLRSGL